MYFLKRSRDHHALFFAFIFLSMSLFPMELQAVEQKGEDVVVPKSQMVNATIKKKSKRSLLTNKGLYLVQETTQFFNAGGKRMTLEALPVPCKAQIWYEPVSNRDPYMVKVILKKILPRASNRFPPPSPE